MHHGIWGEEECEPRRSFSSDGDHADEVDDEIPPLLPEGVPIQQKLMLMTMMMHMSTWKSNARCSCHAQELHVRRSSQNLGRFSCFALAFCDEKFCRQLLAQLVL